MNLRGPNNTPVAFLDEAQWQSIAEALQLSRRESEITRLLLADEAEWSIAAKLSISRHTVHTHLERLYRKLDVTSRSQVILRVFQKYVELSSHEERGPARARDPRRS
jgi:DNA-binding CsgD family transcriptional regulator